MGGTKGWARPHEASLVSSPPRGESDRWPQSSGGLTCWSHHVGVTPLSPKSVDPPDRQGAKAANTIPNRAGAKVTYSQRNSQRSKMEREIGYFHAPRAIPLPRFDSSRHSHSHCHCHCHCVLDPRGSHPDRRRDQAACSQPWLRSSLGELSRQSWVSHHVGAQSCVSPSAPAKQMPWCYRSRRGHGSTDSSQCLRAPTTRGRDARWMAMQRRARKRS
jgi:hypothetical protein